MAITTSLRYLDPGTGSNSASVTAEPCAGPGVTFPCLEAINDPNMAFVHTADDEGNNAVFGFTVVVTP
jgi:pyrimidine deaminase RibD-like protein